MTQFAPGRENGHDGRTDTELDARDVRALTEYMSVLLEGGDVYTVVGQNGGTYTVDAREGRCTCPDAEYRLDDDEACKHERRVAFATGERAIPAWVDRDAIDPDLGRHVDGPRVAATDGGTDVIVAGDDGEVLRESETDEVESEDTDSQERPEDCDCGAWNADADLACWPCYREGFEAPNPTALEGDD